jgi:hypothetical protein
VLCEQLDLVNWCIDVIIVPCAFVIVDLSGVRFLHGVVILDSVYISCSLS